MSFFTSQLHSILMENGGDKPYCFKVISSTGFVTVKSWDGRIVTRAATGNASIKVPPSKLIAIWACARIQTPGVELGEGGRLLVLDCPNENLTRLAVNSLTNLRELNCSHNKLAELILTGDPKGLRRGTIALERLNCSHNDIRELDVSGLTAIRSIDCSRNPLRRLGLGPKLRKLELLDCSRKHLRLINLAALVALKQLNAGENRLSKHGGTSGNREDALAL